MLTGSVGGSLFVLDTYSGFCYIFANCSIVDAFFLVLLAWIFTIVAGVTVAVWSIKKHKNYKKEFGKEYPSNRYDSIRFVKIVKALDTDVDLGPGHLIKRSAILLIDHFRLHRIDCTRFPG